MEHDFYPSGTAKQISWVIKTGDSIIEQKRQHVEMYLDKVNDAQSKYIAYHVGMFWGIGTFVIKNEDTVNVMLDSKTMYDHLANNESNSDEFIETRTGFIKKFINQRKLKINYYLIDRQENLAAELI